MTKCSTCGAELVEAKDGRLYCRPCRRASATAAASPTMREYPMTHCVRGHEFTPENTVPRRDGGRRCRQCQKTLSPRALARAAERRRKATQIRRRAAEEWFDWVVVYRVVSRGDEKPGRQPTIAEWREIFARLPDESTEEIARRAGVADSTVRKYRARLTEGNHVAA